MTDLATYKKALAFLLPPDAHQTGDKNKVSGRKQKKVLSDLGLPAWLTQKHLAEIVSLAEDVQGSKPEDLTGYPVNVDILQFALEAAGWQKGFLGKHAWYVTVNSTLDGYMAKIQARHPQGELWDLVVDCLDGIEMVRSVSLRQDEEPALWEGLGYRLMQDTQSTIWAILDALNARTSAGLDEAEIRETLMAVARGKA